MRPRGQAPIPWGSTLSTGEFAAIREAGFEPAGQVFGACVYNIGYVGAYGCAGGWSRRYPGTAGAPAQVSGQGGFGVRPLAQAMYAARHTAIGRMSAECAALGGHGIVGVSLTFGEFPLGGLEFQAIGTAVRGVGAPAPPHPFTSDLSGQDFAKLIHAGWVPVGLALGISVGARHDDWQTRSTAAQGTWNAEVDGYTELVTMTRHDARVQLADDVSRMGAEGVVVSAIDLRVQDRECPSPDHARDHFAEVTIIGTAIARFASAAVIPPGSLAILSLDPQRRQAARAKLAGQAPAPPAPTSTWLTDSQRLRVRSLRPCASGVRFYPGEMEFSEVIKRRKMVRAFTPEPLAAGTADRLLRAANRAPSAGFSQGYSFLVLEGSDQCAPLWEVLSQGVTSAGDKEAAQRATMAAVSRAPLVIVPLACKDVYLDRYARSDKGWTDRDESRWPVPYWYIDTGFAALLILLAAVDEGLGAVFFGIEPAAIPEFRVRFGVPEEWMPIGAVAVGHPDPAGEPGPSSARSIARKGLDELTHRGRW